MGTRDERLLLSTVSSGIAWATSLATAIVIVPVVLHALGAERYGVFATITAIAGLVGWADFGIGNGLISEVAAAEGREEDAAVRGLRPTASNTGRTRSTSCRSTCPGHATISTETPRT